MAGGMTGGGGGGSTGGPNDSSAGGGGSNTSGSTRGKEKQKKKQVVEKKTKAQLAYEADMALVAAGEDADGSASWRVQQYESYKATGLVNPYAALSEDELEERENASAEGRLTTIQAPVADIRTGGRGQMQAKSGGLAYPSRSTNTDPNADPVDEPLLIR